MKDALRKTKSRKAVGPDLILVEIAKYLGEEGIKWLTELFNVIFRTVKMPSEWRTSTVIPLNKNKADIQDCNNFRCINLLIYMMKLWERVIKRRLRRDISRGGKNSGSGQFGFGQIGHRKKTSYPNPVRITNRTF